MRAEGGAEGSRLASLRSILLKPGDRYAGFRPFTLCLQFPIAIFKKKFRVLVNDKPIGETDTDIDFFFFFASGVSFEGFG